MSKKTGFIASLHKSTKITLFSCISFIVLTCVILAFFVMFPITPSEKVMASIGRENIFNGGESGDPAASAVVGVVTTTAVDPALTSAKSSSSTYTGTTTTKTFKIVITSGSGFMWNGRIPTGNMPGGNFPTTVVDDPDQPTPDPGYQGGSYPPSDYPGNNSYPPATTPSDPGTVTPSVDPGNVTPPADPGNVTPPDDPGNNTPPPVDPGTGGGGGDTGGGSGGGDAPDVSV